MQVHDGKRLLVPLYHGTSEIFLDSIRESGLGAKNPHVYLGTLELLQEIVDCGATHLSKDPKWTEKSTMVDAVLQQRSFDRGFNFRHGSAYVTSSRTTAVCYSLSNAHGSELLSITLDLLRVVMDVDPNLAHDISRRHSEASALLPMVDRYLLIEVVGVRLYQLQSGRGAYTASVLMLVERTVDYSEVMWQQLNFELRAPVAGGSLNAYRIRRVGGDLISPLYDLEVL